MIYKATKKYQKRFVSVRDYDVEKCIKLGEDFTILFEKEKMIIPNAELDDLLQLHNKVMKSKFGKDYKLYDIFWDPIKK